MNKPKTLSELLKTDSKFANKATQSLEKIDKEISDYHEAYFKKRTPGMDKEREELKHHFMEANKRIQKLNKHLGSEVIKLKMTFSPLNF